MDLMLTADNLVSQNQWWKDILRLYALPGETFEIHCWSDERDALALAAKYGSPSSFTIPDIKIIHGVLTDQLIEYFLLEDRPSECSSYNRMTYFFTVRIGDGYSSESYGTEILLNITETVTRNAIEEALLGTNGHIKCFYCE